jgi:hypothetical protein
MQQHGQVRSMTLLSSLTPPNRLLQRRSLLLAPLAMIPLLLGSSPAMAAPATPAEMGLYSRIAAVNVCIARSAGIDFDKAVGVAGETIAQLIQGVHQGQIQQVGAKALTIEELRRGSVNSAVIGAVEICPKQVPPDVKAKVEAAIKQAGAGGKPQGK